MTSESQLQAEIFRALGSRPGVRLFRNNTAGAWGGIIISRTPDSITLRNPFPIHAGLFNGSADIIGWATRHGRAIFTSIEVKSPTGAIRPEQITWRDNVLKAGGIAGIVRSVEEAEGLLQ